MINRLPNGLSVIRTLGLKNLFESRTPPTSDPETRRGRIQCPAVTRRKSISHVGQNKSDPTPGPQQRPGFANSAAIFALRKFPCCWGKRLPKTRDLLSWARLEMLTPAACSDGLFRNAVSTS